MDILKIAEATIKKHNLISPGDKVLIGLSGGADSVALFHILKSLAPKLNITLGAAHINHCLRDTAKRDMEFSKNLCEKEGVPFHSLVCDVKKGAKDAGESEELFARGVRYDFFESLGYDKIATAHNKNDVAETLLFNFMRGSSVKGLSGIPYIRGKIIRPILDIKKQDILEFCRGCGYDFVTDETNLEETYTRNKIRLGLIPKIENEFNPGFVDVVTKNAELFREDSDFLDELARREYKGKVDVSELLKLDMPLLRRVIELHYKKSANTEKNLSAGYISDILELARKNETGKKISLPAGFVAKTQYGKLIIEKNKEKCEFCYDITPGQVLNVPEIGKNVLITECENGDIFLDDTHSLSVRNRRSGDVFYPRGMTGKKRLSDFFTDKKIPEEERDNQVLLLKDGEIVSVVGKRCDRRFCGKTAYKIEIMEADNAD